MTILGPPLLLLLLHFVCLTSCSSPQGDLLRHNPKEVTQQAAGVQLPPKKALTLYELPTPTELDLAVAHTTSIITQTAATPAVSTPTSLMTDSIPATVTRYPEHEHSRKLTDASALPRAAEITSSHAGLIMFCSLCAVLALMMPAMTGSGGNRQQVNYRVPPSWDPSNTRYTFQEYSRDLLVWSIYTDLDSPDERQQ